MKLVKAAVKDIHDTFTQDKHSRWAFTAYSMPEFRKPELVNFYVYQREFGGKNLHPHYQGYVEYAKPYTQKQVKALFKDGRTIHVEPADKTREANMMYCLKAPGYAGFREMFNGINDTWSERHNEFMHLTWHRMKQILGAQESDE